MNGNSIQDSKPSFSPATITKGELRDALAIPRTDRTKRLLRMALNDGLISALIEQGLIENVDDWRAVRIFSPRMTLVIRTFWNL